MTDKINKILDFIYKEDNYILTTHVNADGDAIACVLAFSLMLDKLNKKFRIILDDQKMDSRYSYISNWKKLQSFDKEKPESYYDTYNALLIFDAPGNVRIGDVAKLVQADVKCLKIDHHPSEDKYSDLDWVDIESSSASAMVFEIIRQSKIELDKEIGTAIYTGIIFDTGRLSFSNTRVRDFEICAILTEQGVKPGEITNILFLNNKVHTLNVIGEGLRNLTVHCNGKVSVISLFNKDLQNIELNDLEVLANYSVSVQNSEVGIFIREVEPQSFRISLRSKSYVDVSKIAGHFEGGGHKMASGCKFKGAYPDLIEKLIGHLSPLFK
jgi:phosphoesterase RecJ-like protein